MPLIEPPVEVKPERVTISLVVNECAAAVVIVTTAPEAAATVADVPVFT